MLLTVSVNTSKRQGAIKGLQATLYHKQGGDDSVGLGLPCLPWAQTLDSELFSANLPNRTKIK